MKAVDVRFVAKLLPYQEGDLPGTQPDAKRVGLETRYDKLKGNMLARRRYPRDDGEPPVRLDTTIIVAVMMLVADLARRLSRLHMKMPMYRNRRLKAGLVSKRDRWHASRLK